MDEIQSIKWMIFVLDPTVHVHSAFLAGMPLDGCGSIHHSKLVRVPRHAQLVTRHDSDLCEQCTFRFPTLRAATHVVVGALPLDAHLNSVMSALANQRPARKIFPSKLDALVDGR